LEPSGCITQSQFVAEVRRIHGDRAADLVKQAAKASGHLPFEELEPETARSLLLAVGLPPDAYGLNDPPR